MYIPEKRPTKLTRSPLLVGPRRKKKDCGQRSAFPSETSRVVLLILAHRGSALSGLGNDRSALRSRRIRCVPTRESIPGSPRKCPLPLACHHLPKGKSSGRDAHLGITILNQPYRRRVSTDRLNREEAIWLHPSRVSPTQHPSERPSHTHTTKFRFWRERGRDFVCFLRINRSGLSHTR